MKSRPPAHATCAGARAERPAGPTPGVGNGFTETGLRIRLFDPTDGRSERLLTKLIPLRPVLERTGSVTAHYDDWSDGGWVPRYREAVDGRSRQRAIYVRLHERAERVRDLIAGWRAGTPSRPNGGGGRSPGKAPGLARRRGYSRRRWAKLRRAYEATAGDRAAELLLISSLAEPLAERLWIG